MNLFRFVCTEGKSTFMKSNINFRFWNNLTGLFVFMVSATIYLLTLEPTVSFWDCGEFIASASKLEVCHAPGNPLFLLIGRLASLLAGSNKSHIALMINASSGIASALTIMFLFWTITWFGRKILSSSWQNSNNHKILILGAGFIGAMAYAVSDSFWFSAVEAEVYAMSSLFTAVVFWCIIRWEDSQESGDSSRWILLLSYLFGLGVCVHLLNLLAIPSIVTLYFLKKYPFNWRNATKAFFISIAILGFIFALVIPGIPKLCSWFELLTVNGLGMPFNTGYFAGLSFIVLLIALGIFFSFRKKKVWLYNSLVCLSLFTLGYSTYGVIVIRSHDNPPIDMNNPEDPFSLQYYLNRDQYEKRDLFYGPSFASPIVDTKDKSSYERFGEKYIPLPLNPEYVYEKGSLMFFPRMASNNPEYADAYKQWVNIKGKPFLRTNQNGQQEEITLPTFGENLSFFFRYQLGFMYFRYLMWNFSGRQNDIVGHGNTIHGNWITGIPFIDSLLVGPQDKLPSSMKNNPGRNTYYLLPFILGLIGIWYHYRLDKKNFLILTLLFFFTGIAIVLYLNEVPVVPRERDYVSVGSFYAFAIWIGLGVIGFWRLLENKFKLKGKKAAFIALASSVSIPVVMGYQNWDDHDRSHRYAVLEYARNYLESCEPNAILFTNADNDTYPLWYAQEVEGIRCDIQIVLSPYLSAEWYVDQMRKPSYNKPGLEMKLGQEKIAGGKRTFLPIIEKLDTAIDLNSLLDFVGSEDGNYQVMLSKGEKTNFVPSRKLYLPFDKGQMKNYSFKSGYNPGAVDSISITLKENYLRMDHLLMLDIIASNHWKRPVYFASVQEPKNLGLDKYLQLDGYAYKLTPYKTNPQAIDDIGVIDSETLYHKFMKQFSFASITDPKVYLDNTHVITVSSVALRNKFARLVETLLNEGKKDKALNVLDRIMEILPSERISFDFQMVNIAELYARAGKEGKAKQILTKLNALTRENLDYFLVLPKEKLAGIDFELRVNLFALEEIMKSANEHHFNDIAMNTGLYWKKMENTLIPVLQK